MQTIRKTLLTGLVMLASLATQAPAFAGSVASDLAHQARTGHPSDRVRVIVQFAAPGVNGSALAKAAGGKLAASHPLINGATMDIPLRAVDALSKSPQVAHISPDRQVGGLWDNDVEAMAADVVWNSHGYRGSGVRVAVLDTGVYAGSGDWNRWGGASSRLAAWKDVVNQQATPYDDNGHGTHVAGIIAGSGNDSAQASRGLFTGSAPDADIVAVKVLNAQGGGTVSTVISGLQWVVQNKDTLNIRVVNMSLGHLPKESYKTDPLCRAARQAVSAGLNVVCSAGNVGKDALGRVRYGGINTPGIEPSVITVGALNTKGSTDRSDDTVCTFSSRGPTYIDHLTKPDVLAPGNKIVSVRAPLSTLDLAHPGNQVQAALIGRTGGSRYYTLSGTSMAAPQVAGVVALMMNANPLLSPTAVKGILMYSAQKLELRDELNRPLTPGLSVLTQGAGSVNAMGAIEMALKINPNQPVGTNWLTSGLSHRTTIAGYTFAWSQQILWNRKVLWGDTLMSVKQGAWTNQVLWGDEEPAPIEGEPLPPLFGQQVLWGDDGVAFDQQVWGTEPLWGDGLIWGDCAALSILCLERLIEGED